MKTVYAIYEEYWRGDDFDASPEAYRRQVGSYVYETKDLAFEDLSYWYNDCLNAFHEFESYFNKDNRRRLVENSLSKETNEGIMVYTGITGSKRRLCHKRFYLRSVSLIDKESDNQNVC